MSRKQIPRVFFKGEQYVSFNGMIEAIKEIAGDFCEADFHEACKALDWVAEQLSFAMIVDGIGIE